MISRTASRSRLSVLCAAALLVVPAVAGAQQVLVPAQQPRTVAPAQPVAPAPDWSESNRTLQVIRAQELPHPAVRGQGGLYGAEATRIYQNLLQGIGSQPIGSSGNSGYGEPTGLGQNGGASGYGAGQ